MTPLEIIIHIASAGGSVTVAGHDIKVRMPRDLFTEDLREALRARKAEILAILTGNSHNLTAAERTGLRLLREGEHLPGAAAFLERLRREGKLLPATETRH